MNSEVFDGLSSTFIECVPNLSIPINMSKRQNLGFGPVYRIARNLAKAVNKGGGGSCYIK